MEFHDKVGVPVGLYLWDARLEIAARLLREADLSADDVALLLDFADEESFVTAFGLWSGLAPEGYREHARRLASEIGPLPERFHERAFLARAHSGKLEPAAARELFGWLEDIAWWRGHPAARRDHMAARSARIRDIAVRAALHPSQRGKAEAPG